MEGKREIAVVGMSCRFPGGIDDVDLLWEALVGKRNTAAEVPPDRWSSDWFFSEHASAPGRAYVRRGNFLAQDIRTLDAPFFDLPPRVAENLDPQQRLMLEVVWEAFENAGIPLPALAGENVGVYVGGFMLDHMITHMNPANASIINQNTAAGMMMTMLSNRISHAFDLRGPSLSIDTACSSSLTAFNYGCRDLWSGVCDVAVVGGVNVMTRPEYPVGMSKGQFLARDGECKSFDERGDGYGRGEGAGVVLLKDFELAVADGDRILAKVLATGVNSDGRTPGISMPSGEAQERLARDVCASRGIDPRSIHYVECHGTGTAIGDPTEAGSIGRVYGHGRTGDERAVIGTIKSNIGHTEAVAGVAGVIKAVMTLERRESSPLANLRTPNPDIAFEELGLRLSDVAIPLGSEGETLRAAVNSFGYGGTNAHAILESAPPSVEPAAADGRAAGLPLMLPISARSERALAVLAGKLSTVLEGESPALEDILHTCAHRRAHLSHRAVVTGEDRASLAASLRRLADGESDASVVTGDVPFGGLAAPVFVYTGMGPQWWGMGQELYRGHALFRETLDEADAIFRRVAGFSILEEMLKDEASSAITRTELAQPANFMVQLGLTALLESAGVTPGAIVGHSVGEVGSAYAAGALSLEDALVVSYHRSRTQAKTAGTGTMLAVGLGPAKLAPYLARFGRKIDIAAINGPSTMTVSGDTVSIHALAEDLTYDEVFNRVLTVEVPYHSYLMDPIRDELIESLSGIEPKVPAVPLFSTVTGRRVEGIAYDGPYWADNVRRPVAFMEAIKSLMELGYQTFVEVGPHPVLSAAIQDCARTFGKDVRLVETLRRGTDKKPSRPEPEAVHAAVARAHAAGADVDWHRLAPPGKLVRLPNYPWQRERHWLETDLGTSERVRSTRNPLLGYAKASAAAIWRNELVHASVDYLYDHVVTDTSVMPAAGYIEMMLELGHEVHGDAAGIDVRDLSIAAPLLLNRARAVETIASYDDATSEVQIRSAESGSTGGGKLHVGAQIGRVDGNLVEVHDVAALRERFGPPSDVDRLYDRLATLGLQYGAAFRPVETLYLDHGRGEALAFLSLREDLARVAGYRLHPSLLDGCFQMLMGVLRDGDTLYLPTGFKSIRVTTARTPTRIWCHGRMTAQSARDIVADLTLLDESGRTVATVRGMQATAASRNEARQRVDKWGDEVSLEEASYNWHRAGEPDEPSRFGRWLVFSAEGDELAAETTSGLEAMGAMSPLPVVVGDRFELGEDSAVVRAGSEEDARRLLDEVGDLHGIAFMHGLSAGDESDPTGEIAIETILAVSKALGGLPVERRPRVYYVTREAYAADAARSAVNPAQTAIGAFMRVAHNEIEGTRASLVDLPARVDERVVDLLVAELLADADEDEIAIRGDRRLGGMLELTDVARKPTFRDATIDERTPFRVRPSTHSA